MNSPSFLYPDTQIIIFAREPVYGQVKTRLIPALGIKKATELYKQLLHRTIRQYTQKPVQGYQYLAPVTLCLTPESREDYFRTLLQSDFLTLEKQTGMDLGARMYNALASALQTCSKAILIGTDCPFLTLDDVQQAIDSLDFHDMVFTPASDGGYVLVGAKASMKEAFDFVDWGTEQVMSQTRIQLKKHMISWCELAVQLDIDTEDDLKYLFELSEFKEFSDFM